MKILDDLDYAELKDNRPHRQSERFTSAEFTFETFVVGPSNKLAYAASVSVAEHPAQNYNPLLIYGDSGLGKTHLIYAIANVIRRNDPRSKIAYVKGDDLTNELVDAIREGKTAEMREKYRQADLLLVDDVQFIAGKKQTQEEFFHTFNTLYESGRQIVLTSDRPPSEMTQLEDRLRTRFEWGLLVDVAPPDFETRLAIVKNKAALLGMELPDKISAYIAENVTANVRQLEGHHQQDPGLQGSAGQRHRRRNRHRAIQDMLRRSNEYVPTPEAILEYISKYYSLDESVIRGQQRVRDAVSARQIAMYLIRSMTNLSLDEIGKVFDNRDHSTVLYSIQQIEKEDEEGRCVCRNGEGDQDEYQLQAVTRFLHIFRGKEKTSLWKMVFQKVRGKIPGSFHIPCGASKSDSASLSPPFSTAFFPYGCFFLKNTFLSFFKRAIPTHIFKPRLERKCMHEILL